MNGYMLFERNNNNMCSIASYCIYPIVNVLPTTTTTTTTPTTTTKPSTVVLKRGFGGQGIGHWATIFNLPIGYRLELSVSILSSYMPGTSLRYTCTANNLNNNNVNNFISSDPKCEGQKVLGPLGYFYTSPMGQFTTPLYRCYYFNMADRFHSLDRNCEQRGITNEGLIGYVSTKF